jgi:hypothetical protein
MTIGNKSLLVFLLNDEVRGIKCEYEPVEENPKRQTYFFKTMDQSIEVGDYVVVPTNTRVGQTVVRVTEIDVDPDFDFDKPVSWIIDRVDTSNYTELLEQEEAAIKVAQSAEKRKKREELRKSMDLDKDARINELAIANRSDEALIEPPATPASEDRGGFQRPPAASPSDEIDF